MTFIPIIIVVILLALVVVYVTRPLFTMQDEAADLKIINDKERAQTDYNIILERINELDFDFSLGKLTLAEYHSQRDDLLYQASILRRQVRSEDSAPGLDKP